MEAALYVSDGITQIDLGPMHFMNNATDGTSLGTGVLKDINPGGGGSFPKDKFVIGEYVYFTAFAPEHGRELWRSDGTTTGTQMVKDLVVGSESSIIGGMASVNGELYLVRQVKNLKFEVWLSDGEEAGTRLVAEYESFPDLVKVTKDYVWNTADAALHVLPIR